LLGSYYSWRPKAPNFLPTVSSTSTGRRICGPKHIVRTIETAIGPAEQTGSIKVSPILFSVAVLYTASAQLVQNFCSPYELADPIDLFIEYSNHQRYHEALKNLTLVDIYYGKGQRD
jgi:hypothetical protein